MPKSRTAILANADTLADRFEAADFPDEALEVVTEEWNALRAAVVSAANADRAVAATVLVVRAHGGSWKSIGTVLGLSGEAARRRYSPRADPGLTSDVVREWATTQGMTVRDRSDDRTAPSGPTRRTTGRPHPEKSAPR